MAALEYKPRPKMHSWVPPTPPKPQRSRFYLWGLLAWLLTIAAGYHWMSNESEGDTSGAARDDLPVSSRSIEQLPRTESDVASSVRQSIRKPATSPRIAPQGSAPVTAPVASELPPCEAFLNLASESKENRLPAHLGRSPLDLFIGENVWARPCRAKHRRNVRLCVAIRDGAILGLTIGISPQNLTLETCLREQIAKLVLQPESNLRIIRTTLSL